MDFDALPQAVDTLEDLGPDGTPVVSRVLDGVTITYSNAGATPLTARTYGSDTDVIPTAQNDALLTRQPGAMAIACFTWAAH